MYANTRPPVAHPAHTSSSRRTAIFAYAAGATGILSNLFLIGFYALQVGRPENGTFLGPANDLSGSLSAAFMIPVALALSARLPDRRSAHVIRVLGLSAITVLTVGGPLLALGVLEFAVQAPIMAAAWMILCLWLFLVNRWLRRSNLLRRRVARFGEFLGAGTLLGGVVVGVGLLLPWMSWGQLVLFGVGGVFGFIGFLGIPVWLLLLGRHFAAS